MAYKIFVSIFSFFVFCLLKMCWSLLVCVWKVILSMTNEQFNRAMVASELKNEQKNTYQQTHAFRFGCRKRSRAIHEKKTAVWNFYMRNWISLLIHFGNLLCVVTSRSNFYYSNQIWSKWLQLKRNRKIFPPFAHMCSVKFRNKRNFLHFIQWSRNGARHWWQSIFELHM